MRSSPTPVAIGFEVYGRLNATRDNAVRSAIAPSPGWWDALIGPGKAIDTGRWCVICAEAWRT